MSLLETFFGEKKTITKPIFIKDFTDENMQLKQLEDLSQKLANVAKKEIIERDIAFLRQGISGEKNLYYELKNSFFPMLCLHDIRLVFEDYVAQLDFVVITNKFLCIMETKKLQGNIVINSDGDFIRLIKNKFGKEEKEGIYSPVSQNNRHVNIVKDLLRKKLNICNIPIESLIVIANPKTVINKDKCPYDIKNLIYKYDQVVKQLEKYQNDKKNDYSLDEKNMYRIANTLNEMNTPITFDYSAKYGLCDTDLLKDNGSNSKILSEIKPMAPETNEVSEGISKVPQSPQNNIQSVVETSQNNREQVIENLKKFRLEISKQESIPPYYVFNNAEMDDLIEKYPRTKNDLLTVKGFGPKKVEKYGEQILKILT